MTDGDEPTNDDQTVSESGNRTRSTDGPNGPRKGADRSRRGADNGPNGPRKGADDWDDDWDDDDDDWNERRGPGNGPDVRLIGVIVVAVVLIAAVVLLTRKKDDDTKTTPDKQEQAGSTEPQKGFCGDWPASFGGDGKNVAAAPGLYVWSDFFGIHVRSNATEPIMVKITGNAEYKVKAAGDGVEASGDKGADLSFTLPAGKGTVGPDLDISCEVTTLSIEATKGATPLPPEEIMLGGSSKATTNPARVTRDPS